MGDGSEKTLTLACLQCHLVKAIDSDMDSVDAVLGKLVVVKGARWLNPSQGMWQIGPWGWLFTSMPLGM